MDAKHWNVVIQKTIVVFATDANAAVLVAGGQLVSGAKYVGENVQVISVEEHDKKESK
jgi:hypothetical protein